VKAPVAAAIFPSNAITLRWSDSTSVKGMVYREDLSQIGCLVAIGYLSRRRDFLKGEISDAAFDRLATLAVKPLGCWAGQHYCDLGSCRSKLPPPEFKWRGMTISHFCSTDIVVPDRTIIYVAPALILHYIRVHQYLPPSRFIESALNCPEPGSDEYLCEIKKIAPQFF